MAETDDSADETVRYFACVACGTGNLDRASCSACGQPSPSSEGPHEDIISISLTFAAVSCPECERLSPAPRCLRCGAALEEPDDPGEHVRARQRSFGPLLAEALRIKEAFAFPPPNVRVAADQYMSAVVDAQLFDAMLALLAFAKSMRNMEFSDNSAIGGRTRREIGEYVALLKKAHHQTARIAWFIPPGEAVELRDLLIAMGRHGASIAEETINLLTAETVAQAQEIANRWQTALSTSTDPERFTELFSTLAASHVPDLNARIELALGLEGDFLDPYGLVDLPMVFSAAAGTALPTLDVLAQGAGEFFSHLLATPLDQLDASAIALVFAAVPLAMTDRPFAGHTIARLTHELAMAAHSREPEQTRAVIAGIEEDGASVFAASLRIQRELRLLATGELEGVEDVVIGHVKNYKTLVESAYRTYGQATLNLRAARDGRGHSTARPLLGTLTDRLSAAQDELGELLVLAVDARLRNAEAHEDYRVDASGTIVFSDTQTLDLEAFDSRVEALTTAVAGMQAGVICFGLDHQLFDSAPSWISRGDLPAAQVLLSRSMLAALGVELRNLTLGATVSLVLDAIPLSPRDLLIPLVSIISILDDAEEFRAYGPDGDLILVCPAPPLRAFRDATDDTKKLATIAVTYAAGVATGADANGAFVDALSILLHVITLDTAEDLDHLDAASVFRRTAPRLTYAREFATQYRPSDERSTESVLAAVNVAQRAIKPAARGDTKALNRLATQLGRIQDWAGKQHVQWPPDWLA